MGLMDFIKKQFIDVIQWTEQDEGTLASGSEARSADARAIHAEALRGGHPDRVRPLPSAGDRARSCMRIRCVEAPSATVQLLTSFLVPPAIIEQFAPATAVKARCPHGRSTHRPKGGGHRRAEEWCGRHALDRSQNRASA